MKKLRIGVVAIAAAAVMLLGFGPCDPAPPSCTNATTVLIDASANAQTVVNNHSAGTFYEIGAGTHQSNFNVVPKNGDTFCGHTNSIIDGGNSLVNAFSGSATNVTLDTFTVQNYNTGFQGAAIQPQTNASGWVVRNITAKNNYWAGLMGADGMQVIGGHYTDNGQLGISGNSSEGMVLKGLDNDVNTFDGPELARNRVDHAGCIFEGGGMKWDRGQVTIRNVNVHDNLCRGLWADQNAHDALIENNLVQNNAAEGIAYEISQDATIRNNYVYGNGNNAPDGNGWYWNGGITIMASFNIEIYGNHLTGNYNGITGVQQDRFDDTPPAHLLDHMHVHDNLICATGAGGHPTGVIADNGANLAIRDITFTNNTIQAGGCF